jgi:hypothetical protein
MKYLPGSGQSDIQWAVGGSRCREWHLEDLPRVDVGEEEQVLLQVVVEAGSRGGVAHLSNEFAFRVEHNDVLVVSEVKLHLSL